MSSSRPFVHLHLHTHFSLLDGATRIPDLVKKVKDAGMNALAVTDHGNLYGAIEFYNACRAAGINPVIGYEAYVAPGSRYDKKATRMKEASYHLTLLAMNRTGFQNLVKMASAAFLEGFYYKPRIDKELLEAASEGIICLSGCASSELSHLILAEKMDEARQLTAWYHKVFGDRLYMEIQDCGLKIQRDCAEGTIDIADSMGLPLVATNDAHYLNQDDAPAHDVLLCVNTRSQRSDANRMQMEGNNFYVRTPEEMYAALTGREDAVARTQEIADRVDIELDLTKRHFPVFTPPGESVDSGGLRPLSNSSLTTDNCQLTTDHSLLTTHQYLRRLCEERLPQRYEAVTEEHRRRLDYELSVIEQMGYSSYFLIVWDFVRFAEEQGIPCQARGSACGALVAYLLGLSSICPLKYDLLFERFLDPSRSEPPDIDIDFCRDRRQLVIDYTKEKYGEQNVAQIGTFGTLKAKLAIRDVGRVLGVPLPRVNEVCGMVPETLNIKLSEALKESGELKELYDGDGQVKELIDIAMRIEGLARSAGTHAAGVVVADRPLSEYVPLQTITGKEDIVTQWDGPTVEQVGLLKMDFLGLRNLTILDKAVQLVRKHKGVEIDAAALPLDDRQTFELLQRGETKGIFQLESGGMRDLLQKMKPDSFRDIIATSALYRPGPLEGGMVMDYVNVKHGKQLPRKIHPLVDEVLEETYGVMVYQEQVMRILNRVGNIDLPAAYRCIKAISKKKHKTIAEFREQYIAGAKQNGIDEKVAVELFGLIEKFAGYGFNKSHSTAYAAIAYQTAYLKAHYPQEFMAALLSCGMESSERIAEHVDDCRRMGIEVLRPDVNRSEVEFGVDGEKLTFGLGAVKGLGDGVVGAIVAEREANGPFQSIFDLTERVDSKVLTKSALELLVKAGALDALGPNRAQHMLAVERAVQSAAARHRDKAMGQKNLFGGGGDEDDDEDTAAGITLPDAPDWTHSQKLAAEKEVLGFYLTSHPLAQHAARLATHATHTVIDLAGLADGDEVLVAGMIGSIKKATTRKPGRGGHSRYVNFDLEDASGIVRCIMWPEQYARQGEMIAAEAIVFVKGRLDRRGREPNLIVEKLFTPDEADREFTRQLAVKFQNGLHTEADMRRVREVISRFPGKTDVVIVLDSAEPAVPTPHGERAKEDEGAREGDDPPRRLRYVMSAPTALRVSCGPELRRTLCEVMGEDHVQFCGAAKKRNGPTNGNGQRQPALL